MTRKRALWPCVYHCLGDELYLKSGKYPTGRLPLPPSYAGPFGPIEKLFWVPLSNWVRSSRKAAQNGQQWTLGELSSAMTTFDFQRDLELEGIT